MLVQGGGGNTSVKEKDGTMLVKASGASLAEMSGERGWVRLDLYQLNDVLDRDDLVRMPSAKRELEVLDALMAARVPPFEESARPTVEANLHALLAKYVVHTHPVAMNALACARKGREAAERLFKGWTPPPLWINYADPGFPLALATQRALQRYLAEHGEIPKVIFYQNHGLFVTSDDLAETDGLTEKVIRVIEKDLCRSPAHFTPARASRELKGEARKAAVAGLALLVRRLRAQDAGHASFVRFSDSPALSRFARSNEAPGLVRSGQLTPDEVVYCLKHGCYLNRAAVAAAAKGNTAPAATRLAQHQEKHGYLPKIVTAADLGVFAAGASPSDSANALLVYESAVLAIEGALKYGGPRFLTKSEATYIDTWEVPRYRRTFYAKRPEEKPLAGRIAIVTGAGSGLGKGIAVGLARAGATVALLDVDVDAAQTTAREIAGLKGQALAIRADVTNERSVTEAFHATIEQFGGLDILVNAAGIAPAFPLVDYPLSAWQKTLDINLTGYFLAGREAARVFVSQEMGGSIVNLSSKTGLEASVNNTAYNATKSAEIHLARGWALELGKHGVRVNVVAPGNVFKGSKIWNPQYMRVVAKKRGIKPDEVIPYYVNLTALQKEIEPRDIADAVIFLCSDAARRVTGQTLVCDAGQVLVR